MTPSYLVGYELGTILGADPKCNRSEPMYLGHFSCEFKAGFEAGLRDARP